MIGTETTKNRLFSLEVTEYELRILFRSLSTALNNPIITIDGHEGHKMHGIMKKLLAGE